jgi:hypothetical protein
MLGKYSTTELHPQPFPNILLSCSGWPPKCWDYKHVTSCPSAGFFFCSLFFAALLKYKLYILYTNFFFSFLFFGGTGI